MSTNSTNPETRAARDLAAQSPAPTALLVHGYNGPPQLYAWLQTELANRGYQVLIPNFPPGAEIYYETWRAILDQQLTTTQLAPATSSVVQPALNSLPLIIAHSIGNPFVIKYVAEKQLQIDTFIGLAGFAGPFAVPNRDDLNQAVARMAPTEAELTTFRALARRKFAIYSDDDHIVPRPILEHFPELISATPVFIPGIGHLGHKSGLTRLPALLDLLAPLNLG